MKKYVNKKNILSIVGVFSIIAAVFGITYALFLYRSFLGSSNNTITSGKITVSFEEGDALSLANQYPVSDTESEQGSSFTFAINSMTTAKVPVEYTIYAVQGDVLCKGLTDDEINCKTENYSYRNRLHDYEVKMFLTGSTTGTVPASECISIKNNYNYSVDDERGNYVGTKDESDPEKETLKTTNSLVIATGRFENNIANVNEKHTYSMRMWIPNSVTIGDDNAETGETFTYTSEEYQDLYYSVKINVEANDGSVTE